VACGRAKKRLFINVPSIFKNKKETFKIKISFKIFWKG